MHHKAETFHNMVSRSFRHIPWFPILLIALFMAWAYFNSNKEVTIVYRNVYPSSDVSAQKMPIAPEEMVVQPPAIRKKPSPSISKKPNEFEYEAPHKAGLGTIPEEYNRFDMFMSTQSVICQNITHFGGKYLRNKKPPDFDPDGLWYICLDPQVGLIPGKCVVYSVGINNDWTFDEAIAKYGCRIYAFDPTIHKSDHFHTPQIQFFNLGLADKDSEGKPGAPGKEAWKTRTLASLIKELGHANRHIDILKIDIERDEWTCLPQMLTDGTLKKYVRQMVLEIHINRSAAGHRMNYGIVMWLERQGFKIANLHKNMYCPNCYEITYINTNLVNLKVH